MKLTSNVVTTERIMIVDDEESICRGFSLILQSDDWIIEMETNPDVALRQLKSKRYSVMLLDYRMPEMDGLIMAQRQADLGIYCPTILISAVATTDNVLAATRVGIVDYLSKPVNPPELRLAVRHLLWRHNQFKNFPVEEIKGLPINDQYECAKHYLQKRDIPRANRILLDLLDQQKDEASELLLGIMAELGQEYATAEKFYSGASDRGEKKSPRSQIPDFESDQPWPWNRR